MISGTQPNFRDSGHSAPAQSHGMRQKTFTSAAPVRAAARARLLHLGLAIDREERTPSSRARTMSLLLDRVAEGDAVGRRAGFGHELDLHDRGRVEREPSSARSFSTSSSRFAFTA